MFKPVYAAISLVCIISSTLPASANIARFSAKSPSIHVPAPDNVIIDDSGLMGQLEFNIIGLHDRPMFAGDPSVDYGNFSGDRRETVLLKYQHIN